MLDHAQALTLEDVLVLLTAAGLAILGVARAARLLIFDKYPPVVWLRLEYATWTAQTERRAPWLELIRCTFCLAPYLAAGNLGWALWSGLDWGTFWGGAWWIVNAWAALSYVAAMVVVRDEPADNQLVLTDGTDDEER